MEEHGEDFEEHGETMIMEELSETQAAEGTKEEQEVTAAQLMKMMRDQLAAAERREKQLNDTLRLVIESTTPSQAAASRTPARQIAVERPILLSTSSLAEFSAWEEEWKDYAICQQLATQSQETRVSAVRLSMDEEIRRFLREGIIKVSGHADVPEIISAVKTFIRGQRNPLLDRIDFYNRQQDKGESFDAFYAALRELYNVSDFQDISMCHRCSGKICSQCERNWQKVREEMMRDRIVTGIRYDEVRHKLLAQTDLTLKGVIQICKAEEAALRTEEEMSTPGIVHVMRTKYGQEKPQRQKWTGKEDKAQPGGVHRCPNCGYPIHKKNLHALPLISSATNSIKLGIFKPCAVSKEMHRHSRQKGRLEWDSCELIAPGYRQLRWI